MEVQNWGARLAQWRFKLNFYLLNLSKALNSNMSKSCLNIFIFLFGLQLLAASSGRTPFAKTEGVTFKENKGQIHDQNDVLRNDVLFTGNSGDLIFHLRNNGVSYQMYRVDTWKKIDRTNIALHRSANDQVPDQTTIYRLDINWLGANANASVKKEDPMSGHSTYYTTSAANGITDVKSYGNVELQELYEGINLKWYSKNGQLKYDYLVSAGADHKQIQLEIRGATKLSVNSKGELEIETPLGKLNEQAPLVTQSGRTLKAKWLITGSIVSFNIEGIDPTQAFVIDPLVRLWGTYFGGLANDNIYFVTPDALGNVYVCGESLSLNNIATTGAHQTVFGGAASSWGDAFLAKFTSAGVNLWSTYYGGTGGDIGNGLDVDATGSFVLLTGVTTSTAAGVIATPGSHQPNFGGSAASWGDAFLALFDANGIRQWGTYYGGTGDEWLVGGCFDNTSNAIYVSGGSQSSNAIATPGSHQPALSGSFDGFLAKFDLSGARLWATYYGGSGYDNGNYCKVDQNGDVYLIGQATSATNISSLGSHQPLYGGGSTFGDGYIAKFTSSGTRIWATYYGGAGDDWAYNCAINSSGDIYVSGTAGAASAAALVTAGAHQTVYGGGSTEAFLVKFNSLGARQWSTLYGGSGTDDKNYCAIDPSGNVYLTGVTNSAGSNVIATACAYQQYLAAGIADAYLAKFTPAGVRMWGTYYGAFGLEDWPCCNCDNAGNVYLVGTASSNNPAIMTSAGAYQTVFGGALDGFIAKFDGCVPVPPVNTTNSSSLTICQGRSTTLTTNSICAQAWYNVATGGNPLSNLASFTTPNLAVTTTYYIEDATCGPNNSRTPVTVTVNPVPVFSISASSRFLCPGTSATLTPVGAVGAYTWTPDPSLDISNSSFAIATPPNTKTYSLTASDGVCIGTGTVLIAIFPNPTLSITNPVVYLCSGKSATLNVQGATNYTWSPAASINSPNSANVLASPSNNTTYTITGSNSFSNVTCSDQETLTVYVVPYLTNSAVSESVSLCLGQSATLNASGGPITTWSPIDNMDDPNAPEVHVTSPVTTVYSVNISSNGLCPITRTVLVQVNPIPAIDVGRDTTYNVNETMYIAAIGSGTITWLDGSNIYCKVCPMTQVMPTKSSCYTAKTVNDFGCTAYDQICIEVTENHYIYVPNSFTPNHDGLNDEFRVIGEGIRMIKMVIYDRWGHEMYFKEGEDVSWDGTYKGETCEEGVYLYRFLYQAISGEKIYKMGSLTLLTE
jgi:gliding motility-associated-like protein